MRVVIAGVAGVGKSTVLDIVSSRSGYTVKNFGSVMLDLAISSNLVKDRDEIRKLPVERQIELQRSASQKLGTMDNIIIDTHMSIKSPGGYLPGLPEWVLRELNVSSYFLIEADPKEIKKRREEDPTRHRDDDTIDDIYEHQMVNRQFAISYSVFSGATVNFITNPTGHPELAAENIIRRLA
ncbi:adenylate kinase [Picrophilus oshimae]|uniref:Adenylate kinase n=1 Tax=Picrophilus torridus (strain ATCC 700027 / DSM 9790 / JCM 10055 / NBRC 100828 / KAW 2/3) TaxID=1122961 RepID=Q6L1A3_PICTO|nr:adenylate kinase [Picrophilus oshimae]AAT43249.1 adenylate kinase [Picrophilus oshimae DSM 9789]SMD30445.1 adenylate kinase [Picrophilus oshimae DSM 9789]